MKKYRLFGTYTIIILIVIIAGIIGKSIFIEKEPEAADKLILRYGDVNPDGNITVKTAKYFAEQVSELSDGRIEIDVYSSGILGDEMQSYRQLQMGALDFYRANSASLGRIGDMDVNILSLPYLFADREHMWRVCGGEIGDTLLADIIKSGSQMVGIFYVDEGERNLFMVNAPVHSLEELKGKEIRAMLSDTLYDTLSALGAVPVQMTYAQTYNALSLKEVDGAENPVVSYYSNKFYRVAPYYIMTGHMYSPGIVVMSEIIWNNLSETDRQIILNAAGLAEEYSRNEIKSDEEAAYKSLERAGVEITVPEDMEEWETAATSIYGKYTVGKEDILNRIREMR